VQRPQKREARRHLVGDSDETGGIVRSIKKLLLGLVIAALVGAGVQGWELASSGKKSAECYPRPSPVSTYVCWVRRGGPNWVPWCYSSTKADIGMSDCERAAQHLRKRYPRPGH